MFFTCAAGVYCTYLGIVADIIPPRRVEYVITFHDFLEHLRFVVGIKRLIAAQSETYTVHVPAFTHLGLGPDLLQGHWRLFVSVSSL